MAEIRDLFSSADEGDFFSSFLRKETESESERKRESRWEIWKSDRESGNDPSGKCD